MLTTEDVARFAGGQMEIQNSKEGYLYRGQIATIAVEDEVLRVQFVWLAKGQGVSSEGGFPIPHGWVKDDRLDYEASLSIYTVSNIGPSGHEVGGSDRFCLTSWVVGETVVLYPPDGSRLDPAKVEGLQLAQV